MAITYSSPTITITGGQDTGTATSGSTTTIVDTSKSWGVNAMAGRFVYVHTGTGLGQRAYIASNTSNTLTLERAVDTAFASGSQYIIGYKLSDILAANNAGGWGQVTNTGNLYTIACRLTLGNGSTKTYLSTVSEVLVFSSATPALNCLGYSYLQFGDKYQDRGYRGSKLMMPNTPSHGNKIIPMTGSTYNLDWYQADNSKLWFFGSEVYRDVNPYSTYNNTGIHIGLDTSSGTEIVDSNLEGLWRIEIKATNFSLKKSRMPYNRSSFGIFANPSAIEDVDIYNNPWAMTIGKNNTTFTFRGLNITNNDSPYTGTILWFDDAVASPSHNSIVNMVDSTYFDYSRVRWFAAGNNAIYFKSSFDFTVKNTSGSALSGVRVYLEETGGTQQLNDTTGAGGQLSTTPDIITKLERISGTTSYDPYTFKLRKYGYSYSELSKDFSSKVENEVSVLYTNAYVVANEATAAAYTGISVDGANKTITVSGTRTIQELYDYLQWWGTQSTTIQYDEPLTTADGVIFTLATGWTFSGENYITGGDILRTATGNSYVTITLSNLVDGSRYAIYKTSDMSVLASGLVSGTTLTTGRLLWSADYSITVRVRKAGYLPYEAISTLTNAGANITAAQAVDNIYQA